MNRFLIFFFRYDIPLISVLAGVFYLSSLPGSTFDPYHFEYADKFAHVLVYMVVGFMFARLLSAGPSLKGRYSIIVPVAIILSGIYGLSDEWHQSYVQGRSAEALDLVADLVGGCLGSFLIIPYRRFTDSILSR